MITLNLLFCADPDLKRVFGQAILNAPFTQGSGVFRFCLG